MHTSHLTFQVFFPETASKSNLAMMLAMTNPVWMTSQQAKNVSLAMRNTDLLSIQALLGMALSLQGTLNPHFCI
jgi:hypothetical protein